MKCNNCGEEIGENENYCHNCGAKIYEELNEVEKEPIKNIQDEEIIKDKRANILTWISLVMLLVIPGIFIILESANVEVESTIKTIFKSVVPSVGFILLVYIRIRYPNNKNSKTLMKFQIVLIIIDIIFAILGVLFFIWLFHSFGAF